MPKNYVYTDLTAKDSVYMEILGQKCAVTQFTSSWAANEIPTALVALPVGRDAKTRKQAEAHTFGRQVKQMEKVIVWFEPKGEFDRGVDWPKGKVKIFEGFFTGLTYRKMSGKVHVICNLLHWSAALAFSSALTKNGHVSNPTSLNTAAVFSSLKGAGTGQGNLLSMLTHHQLCVDDVLSDLWKGVKGIFCALANVKTMSAGRDNEIAGSGEYAKNDVALDALGRIEGPGAGCSVPYKHGVPLKLQTDGVGVIENTVANSIGNEFVDSYANVSFWDKLVGQICPMFNMAFVPMVETGIVVADCPAYNGDFWKEISSDDYDVYDLTRELHRPLRAVGVIGGYSLETQVGINGRNDILPAIGGVYTEDSVRPGDGMILYVATPPWLANLNFQPNVVGGSTGLKNSVPIKGATAPQAGQPDAAFPDAFGANVTNLFRRYAKSVFVNQMLRGQAGSISGKLRFDVAPLSILKVTATSDKFIGRGQDDLAFDIYGCVQRVTISINAESGMAGTTFAMSHVRTEAENKVARTSVSEHPLFGKSIHGGGKHGSPLLDVMNEGLLVGDGPIAPPPIA